MGRLKTVNRKGNKDTLDRLVKLAEAISSLKPTNLKTVGKNNEPNKPVSLPPRETLKDKD